MSDAPAPTRAEEGRETCAHCGAKLTDEEREFYGNGCETCEGRLHAALVADDLRAALEPTEVQRAEARAAQAEAEVARLTQERDEALCLAEGPSSLLDLARGSVNRGMELHAAEAEVARLTAAVAISEIAVRSLQARAAAFERALKVRHPLTGKDASAWLVLADLAAQEGCDGEPYDTMQAVADALRATLTGGDR